MPLSKDGKTIIGATTATQIVLKNGAEYWIEGVLIPTMGMNGRYLTISLNGRQVLVDYWHDEITGHGVIRVFKEP